MGEGLRDGRPRARTEAHLRRLAAAAATGTALTACGFAVVDPMPPPSKCEGAAGQFKATASWKLTGATRLLEIVLVSPPARPDIKVSGSATSTAGTVMDTRTEGDTTTILIDPNPAYPTLSSAVGIACTAGAASINIQVTQTSDAGDESLSVAVYDVAAY